jgi:glutamate/tyrosine decarboxylase-like PLP-dependent enzyme
MIDPKDPSKKIVEERRGYWILADGALGGGYLPYLHKYYEKKNEVVD